MDTSRKIYIYSWIPLEKKYIYSWIPLEKIYIFMDTSRKKIYILTETAATRAPSAKLFVGPATFASHRIFERAEDMKVTGRRGLSSTAGVKDT